MDNLFHLSKSRGPPARQHCLSRRDRDNSGKHGHLPPWDRFQSRARAGPVVHLLQVSMEQRSWSSRIQSRPRPTGLPHFSIDFDGMGLFGFCLRPWGYSPFLHIRRVSIFSVGFSGWLPDPVILSAHFPAHGLYGDMRSRYLFSSSRAPDGSRHGNAGR